MKTKVRVGRLTELELEIVLDSIRQVCKKLNVDVSEPTKPEPMYRDIVLTGEFKNVRVVTHLMSYCEIQYD